MVFRSWRWARPFPQAGRRPSSAIRMLTAARRQVKQIRRILLLCYSLQAAGLKGEFTARFTGLNLEPFKATVQETRFKLE